LRRRLYRHQLHAIIMDPSTLWIITAVLLASFIRSFTGFGFSLLLVPSLLLCLPPQIAIPLVILLDLPISLFLWSKIRRDIDWPSLKLILPLAILTVPLGILTLEYLSPTYLKLAASLFVFLTALALIFGYRLSSKPRPFVPMIAGGFSGFLGAAIGMAGPPVIVFYFSRQMQTAQSRASIMAYFLFLGLVTSMGLYINNSISSEVINYCWQLLPFLLIGTWLGDKVFTKTHQDLYKKIVYVLLILLSLMNVVKLFWS
jgi:uncharacterized membrane protein YfcA